MGEPARAGIRQAADLETRALGGPVRGQVPDLQRVVQPQAQVAPFAVVVAADVTGGVSLDVEHRLVKDREVDLTLDRLALIVGDLDLEGTLFSGAVGGLVRRQGDVQNLLAGRDEHFVLGGEDLAVVDVGDPGEEVGRAGFVGGDLDHRAGARQLEHLFFEDFVSTLLAQPDAAARFGDAHHQADLLAAQVGALLGLQGDLLELEPAGVEAALGDVQVVLLLDLGSLAALQDKNHPVVADLRGLPLDEGAAGGAGLERVAFELFGFLLFPDGVGHAVDRPGTRGLHRAVLGGERLDLDLHPVSRRVKSRRGAGEYVEGILGHLDLALAVDGPAAQVGHLDLDGVQVVVLDVLFRWGQLDLQPAGVVGGSVPVPHQLLPGALLEGALVNDPVTLPVEPIVARGRVVHMPVGLPVDLVLDLGVGHRRPEVVTPLDYGLDPGARPGVGSRGGDGDLELGLLVFFHPEVAAGGLVGGIALLHPGADPVDAQGGFLVQLQRAVQRAVLVGLAGLVVENLAARVGNLHPRADAGDVFVLALVVAADDQLEVGLVARAIDRPVGDGEYAVLVVGAAASPAPAVLAPGEGEAPPVLGQGLNVRRAGVADLDHLVGDPAVLVGLVAADAHPVAVVEPVGLLDHHVHVGHRLTAPGVGDPVVHLPAVLLAHHHPVGEHHQEYVLLIAPLGVHQIGAGLLEGNLGGAHGLHVIAAVVGGVLPGGNLAAEPLLGGLDPAEVLLEIDEGAVGIQQRAGIGQGLFQIGLVGVEADGLEVAGGDADFPLLARREDRVGVDGDPAPAQLVEAGAGVADILGLGKLLDQPLVALFRLQEAVAALQDARGGAQSPVQVGAHGIVAHDALDQLERIQPGYGDEDVRLADWIAALSGFIAFLVLLLGFLLPLDRRHLGKCHQEHGFLMPGFDDRLGALFGLGFPVDFFQQEDDLGAFRPGEVVLGVFLGGLYVLFRPEAVPDPPAAGLHRLDQGQVVFHGLFEQIPVFFRPGLFRRCIRQQHVGQPGGFQFADVLVAIVVPHVDLLALAVLAVVLQLLAAPEGVMGHLVVELAQDFAAAGLP